MRKCLLVLLGIVLGMQAAQAQRIEIEAKLKLAEDSAKSKAYTINFSIKGSRPGDVYTVSIEDRNKGKATPTADYTFSPNPTPVTVTNSTSMLGSFTITVNNDAEKGEPDESIILRLQAQKATSPDTMLIKYVTFTITDADKPAPSKYAVKAIADTSYNNLKILTAASFDFFGKPQFKEFAGDLTLNMPELWSVDDKLTIGLNTSIFHYHYYTADSSRGRNYAENILLDPATQALIPDSTRFVRNGFNLESKSDYRTWGYNIQMLFGRADLDKKRMVRSYPTLHLEGLSTRTTTETKKIPIRADTLVYNAGYANRPFTGIARPVNTVEVTNRAKAYFGVGYTTYVSIPKKFDFYGQVISGISTNNPESRVTFEELPPNGRRTIITTTSDQKWFYLFKTRITEKYTKLNGTAGVEVRGNVGETEPFIAAYLGIQLSLDAFFKK